MGHKFLQNKRWLLTSIMLAIFLVLTTFFGHQLSLPISEHPQGSGGSHTVINCEVKCGSKPVEVQTVEATDEQLKDDDYLYTLTRNALAITLFGIILYQLTQWLGTLKIPIYKQVACYRI